MPTESNRRVFLKQAGLSALAFPLTGVAGLALKTKTFTTATADLRNQLLSLANRERAQAGVGSLKPDEFACKIAEKHAIEMAQNNFLSHWGLDGRKPYHRYSFGGGTEATSENDAATDHDGPIASEEMEANVIQMHKSMHGEVPPNDGHRQTILAPHHTHVGFGMATRGFHVRLCELYVARYVNIDPYSVIKPPRSEFLFSGQLMNLNYSVEGIDVFYEPLPTPPKLSWLQIPRPYGLPQDRDSLMPRLPANTYYDDGTSGTIDFPSRGRFRVPISLSRKQPGIYTLVVWIQRGKTDQPFPATHVCIRAE
jgi:uncharacterized protein YkwD